MAPTTTTSDGASGLLSLAMAQLIQGDSDKAVQLLRTAVAADQHDVEARLLLIEACLQRAGADVVEGQEALADGEQVAR